VFEIAKTWKEMIEESKGLSEAVNRRRDNTMAKRLNDKGTNNKVQNTNQKLKNKQHEPY
jgi:hypothetical protein